MPGERPTTIAEYIQAAPAEGHAHLRQMHALLKGVAPKAEETIKWGTPFFVEPRLQRAVGERTQGRRLLVT